MRRFSCAVLFLFLPLFGFAGSPGVSRSVSEIADSVLSLPALRGSTWSILITHLDKDSVILNRNPEGRLIPASVTKLVTTAAALDALGSTHRFVTRCYSLGEPDEMGVLRSDLYIQASGDPTMHPREMKGVRATILSLWADSLENYGIREIKGDIVMKTLPYALERSTSSWEIGDVNSNFAPPVDGFGFNSNVCHLGVHPASVVGDPAVFTVDPPYAPLAMQSSIKTVSAESDGWISFESVPSDTTIKLSGEIRAGDDGEYLWVPMQDPALFLGRAFATELASRGLEVSGSIKVDRWSPSNSGGFTLFESPSLPLSYSIAVANKESDNFTAEYLLRAIGQKVGGRGDARTGLEGVTRFLRSIGISESSITISDGCGLSRHNLCTAEGIVKLLTAMDAHPERDAYRQSLAVSGYDGTMEYRLSTEGLAGRVVAKTGTIMHVCTLAGYAIDQQGGNIAFAILCNNFTCSPRVVRVAQDRMLEAVLTSTPKTQ